jgi:hypothetical protein
MKVTPSFWTGHGNLKTRDMGCWGVGVLGKLRGVAKMEKAVTLVML